MSFDFNNQYSLRYKGYEVLLDIDESLLENDIPKGESSSLSSYDHAPIHAPFVLHSNMRAIHYMLDHTP